MEKISCTLWVGKKLLLFFLIILIFLLGFITFNNRIHAQTLCGGGDLDCDGKYDLNDLLIMLTLYGTNTPAGDLNGNGVVDIIDTAVLVSKIQNTYVSPTPTPTPTPFPLYDAAKERVPDFCTPGVVPGGGSIVTTTKSGNYSDPSVWSNGSVPNNIANGVQILPGHTVIYDESPQANISLSCIKIAERGSLLFKTNQDTKLTVGTITDFGYLEVGSEANPVRGNVKAEIMIADQSLMINTATPSQSKDPNQLGTGLLVLKNGKLRIHGEIKQDDPNIYNTNTHAFIRLTQEPKSGDTTLKLSENALAYHWRVGDKIILPDSRQAPSDITVMEGVYGTPFPLQIEYPIIKSISSDGLTIMLTSSLQYNHPGARDADGTLKFLPHIGNLTRNVLIHSQNPNGVRGHSLFSERADIDIRYAEFDAMGRTRAEVPLDNVGYDGNGVANKIGTNQIARYTLHFHHDEGPIRTASQQTDSQVFQAILMGNAIDEGNASKWGITIHDTSFGLFKNNTITGAVGSGIMQETGNEYKDIVEGNFVVGSRGSGGTLGSTAPESRANTGNQDWGWEGTGFWAAGPYSLFRNNVAASNKFAGYEMYLPWSEDPMTTRMNMIPSVGFVAPDLNAVISYFPQNPNWCVQTAGTDFRGADSYNPTQNSSPSNPSCVRIAQFLNNEAYGVTERGVHVWGTAPNILDGSKVWNTNFAAIELTYQELNIPLEDASPRIINSVIRGDINQLKDPFVDSADNWDARDAGPYGIKTQMTQYSAVVDVENNDVQGFKSGIAAPQLYLIAKNNLLRNYQNIWIQEGHARQQRNIYLINNDFRTIPNLTLSVQPQRDIYMAPRTIGDITNGCDASCFSEVGYRLPELWNLTTHPDFIRIWGYKSDGATFGSGDYRLYFLEQDPNFNIKNTNAATQASNEFPSLTNQQAWSQLGNAVADAVAPCNTTAPKVRGYLCPIDTTYQTYANTDGPNPFSAPTVMVDVNGGVFFTSQNSLDLEWRINDGTYFGYSLVKNYDTSKTGVIPVTVTDQDIPAADRLKVLDIDKNGVIDANETFKKTFYVVRIKNKQ